MKVTILVASALAGATLIGAADAQTRLQLTTADPGAADSSVHAGQNESADEAETLSIQYSPLTNQSSKIYLQFNMLPLQGRRVDEATLSLQPIGGYHGHYHFNVFGLSEPADVALSRQWDAGAAPIWSSAPANDSSAGGGLWREASRDAGASADAIRHELTHWAAGVDPNMAEYLGGLSIRPGRLECKLPSERLSAFLQGDRNGVVTLILTAATTSSEPTTFASAEHEFFSAPTLELVVSPTSLSERSLDLVNQRVAMGGVEQPLSLHWMQIDTRAHRPGWSAQLDAVDTLAAALGSSALPGSSADASTALGGMLKAEARYRANQIDEAQWGERLAGILQRQPVRGEELVHAFLRLSAIRGRAGGENLPPMSLKPLLEHELPMAVQQAVAQWVSQRDDAPPSNTAADRLVHFRQRLNFDDDSRPDVHAFAGYLDAFGEMHGRTALNLLLRQLTLLNPSSAYARVAAQHLLRDRTSLAEREALIISMVEANPESTLAERLTPFYLSAMARRGALEEAIALLQTYATTRPASQPERDGEVPGGGFEELAPEMPLGEAYIQMAQQYYKCGHFAAATKAAHTALHRLPSGRTPPRLPDATPAAEQATAALRISLYLEASAREMEATGFLQEARAASVSTEFEDEVLFHVTRRAIARGDLDEASEALVQLQQVRPGDSDVDALKRALELAQPTPHSQITVAQKIDEHLALARKAEGSLEAVGFELAAADLALEIGWLEQAAYIYANHLDGGRADAAASGLARCVVAFRASPSPERVARADHLRKLLDSRLGAAEAATVLSKAAAAAAL